MMLTLYLEALQLGFKTLSEFRFFSLLSNYLFARQLRREICIIDLTSVIFHNNNGNMAADYYA